MARNGKEGAALAILEWAPARSGECQRHPRWARQDSDRQADSDHWQAAMSLPPPAEKLDDLDRDCAVTLTVTADLNHRFCGQRAKGTACRPAGVKPQEAWTLEKKAMQFEIRLASRGYQKSARSPCPWGGGERRRRLG